MAAQSVKRRWCVLLWSKSWPLSLFYCLVVCNSNHFCGGRWGRIMFRSFRMKYYSRHFLHVGEMKIDIYFPSGTISFSPRWLRASFRDLFCGGESETKHSRETFQSPRTTTARFLILISLICSNNDRGFIPFVGQFRWSVFLILLLRMHFYS